MIEILNARATHLERTRTHILSFFHAISFQRRFCFKLKAWTRTNINWLRTVIYVCDKRTLNDWNSLILNRLFVRLLSADIELLLFFRHFIIVFCCSAVFKWFLISLVFDWPILCYPSLTTLYAHCMWHNERLENNQNTTFEPNPDKFPSWV